MLLERDVIIKRNKKNRKHKRNEEKCRKKV
jgi:hypothetical protein